MQAWQKHMLLLFAQLGRRRGLPRRPPTPPYEWFRTGTVSQFLWCDELTGLSPTIISTYGVNLSEMKRKQTLETAQKYTYTLVGCKLK